MKTLENNVPEAQVPGIYREACQSWERSRRSWGALRGPGPWLFAQQVETMDMVPGCPVGLCTILFQVPKFLGWLLSGEVKDEHQNSSV